MDPLSTLPPLDARWVEHKAQGLVFTRSPTELTFRLWFPELVGKKHLEIFTLRVEARAAHCHVAGPFAKLFTGDARSFFFDDKVLFLSVGGFDVEHRTLMQPHEWVEKNVRAAEALQRAIDEAREFFRDEHLPEFDLKSGIFEIFVKDYKFHKREFPNAKSAAEEFCRRFADNKKFQELFHPELSALRYFAK